VASCSRVKFTILPILYAYHAGLPTLSSQDYRPNATLQALLTFHHTVILIKRQVIFMIHNYYSTLPTIIHSSLCSALHCLQPIFTRRTSGHFPGTFRAVCFLFHLPAIIHVLPLTTRRILLLFCPSHVRGIWNGNRILHISCANCRHWTPLSVAYCSCFLFTRHRLQISAQNQSGLKDVFIFPHPLQANAGAVPQISLQRNLLPCCFILLFVYK